MMTNQASLTDQLKNKANFLDSEGRLYLLRCMNCPDAGERGRENYGPAVASGVCAWCGWNALWVGGSEWRMCLVWMGNFRP